MTGKVAAGVGAPVLVGGAGVGVAYGIKSRNKEVEKEDVETLDNGKEIPPKTPEAPTPSPAAPVAPKLSVTNKYLKSGAQEKYLGEIRKNISIDDISVLEALKKTCDQGSASTVSDLVSRTVNNTSVGKQYMQEILGREKPNWNSLSVENVCVIVKLALSTKDNYLVKAAQMDAQEATKILKSADGICLANSSVSDRKQPLSFLFGELGKSIGVDDEITDKSRYEGILQELEQEWSGSETIDPVCKSIKSVI